MVCRLVLFPIGQIVSPLAFSDVFVLHHITILLRVLSISKIGPAPIYPHDPLDFSEMLVKYQEI